MADLPKLLWGPRRTALSIAALAAAGRADGGCLGALARLAGKEQVRTPRALEEEMKSI